jgi:hypothetical protein
VFSSSTMGLCRKIVQLCCFPVCLVHAVSSWKSAGNSPLSYARNQPIFFGTGEFSLA